MTHTGNKATPTLDDLDARLREVEAVQQMILRLLSTTKPLETVLEHYGATDTQERAFYPLLDELCVRARGREQHRPTFAYFLIEVVDIFPSFRCDREFALT